MNQNKRKLKRHLNLLQVIMLGTAGTISAEIFVLTGHAAGIAGSATVFALLVGGLLSLSIALNYCELATAFPVAGGAMSYVRESFGAGLLSYLVGSVDCLSSTFYVALSAVGFSYSLEIFIPGLPIIPAAVAVILVFVALNLYGTGNVGNTQIILGSLILAVFAIYIVGGLISPTGFSWETFNQGFAMFEGEDATHMLSRMLVTIALVYNAYVGFEVIADDAEEIQNPERNIPIGILVSLGLTTVIYTLVSFVTLGTLPLSELAGSETALSDAAARFLSGWAAPLLGLAGIVATLTTINSAMLSATREAFSLGRDGVWPSVFAKLNGRRIPWVSVLFVGAVCIGISFLGEVDFLSYISAAGYLFVLFWSSLAMVKLRKQFPDIPRPFKVPFYPLTAYLAGLTCILIIAFSDKKALLFCAGMILIFAIAYYVMPELQKRKQRKQQQTDRLQNRIVVPVANPNTARSLFNLARIFTSNFNDLFICILTIDKPRDIRTSSFARKSPYEEAMQREEMIAGLRDLAIRENVAMYTKRRNAPTVTDGILDEVTGDPNVKFLLLGWPGTLRDAKLIENPVKQLIQRANANVAVLLDRGLMTRPIKNILVPIGGGPHSRLALLIAVDIAQSTGGQIVALRTIEKELADDEEIQEDHTAQLSEIIDEELGGMPENLEIRTVFAKNVQLGVLKTARTGKMNLIVLGASEEYALNTRLFGEVDDWIADESPCSVLLVRRYEPDAVSWLRRRIKGMPEG